MPALPTQILTQLVNVPHEPELKQAFIVAKDLAPDETPPWESAENGAPEIAFQYWPESLTDSRESTWNPRYIPGGSHPIYQWTHGGERRLSFTAVFTTDTEPDIPDRPGSGGGVSESGVAQAGTADSPYNASVGDFGITSGLSLGKRDVDLRSVVSWLRYFTYPFYGTGGSGNDIRVFEPPKVMLVMPNSKLAHNGSDHITTVMTQCEVTYQEWFPNGFPRIIEVGLEFAEVVQEDGSVRFHNREDMGLMSGQIGTYLARREG